MKKRKTLKSDELVTMKVIWDAQGGITKEEIVRQLRELYDVVFKEGKLERYLQSLEEMGLAAHDEGAEVTYHELVSQEDYCAEQMREYDRLFGKKSLLNFPFYCFEHLPWYTEPISEERLERMRLTMEKMKDS